MRTLTTPETMAVSGNNKPLKAISALGVGIAAAIYTAATIESSSVVATAIGAISGGAMGHDIDTAAAGVVIGGAAGWYFGSAQFAAFIYPIVSFTAGTMITSYFFFGD